MKKIVFTILFIMLINLAFAQTKKYKVIIDKVNNSTIEIWVQDIKKISYASYDFTCGTSTVSYVDRIYNTVSIGSQCWLKENLNIGTKKNCSTVADSMKNNGVIEKYCYDNDTNNCNTYGGLYQWNEAMKYGTTSGAKGICPTGWHIPTLTEWTTLKTTVANDGNALKSIDQGIGIGAGTNTSGFSALLSGYLDDNFTFYGLTKWAYIWSSTIFNSDYAYTFWLGYNAEYVTLNYYNKQNFGFSVRCLQD